MPSSCRLARSSTGQLLLGDADGFVPLASVMPGMQPPKRWTHASAGTFPSINTASASRIPAEACSFGSPLNKTGARWGIGLNYKDHAHDLGETRPVAPASFIKPPTVLVGPGGPIRLPPPDVTSEVTGEAELAIVIGRTCRDVTPDEADRVVAGIVPVIDMTAVDILQQNPRFLTRAKSFDTFLVVGPWIETARSLHDLEDVEVRTVVDGDTVAANTIAHMAFSPAELVASLSRSTTLQPGDLICTGTPGAHRLAPGMTIRAEVDRVGAVEAPVVASNE